MDPFFSLILLCIAMLVASFLAGNVPLSFHLSEDRLKLISNFGVGLLVGTALVVIIPEGVETLYSTPHTDSAGVALNTNNQPITKRFYRRSEVAAPRSSNSDLHKRENNIVVLNAEHPYLIQDQFKRDDKQAASFEDNMLLTRQDDTFISSHLDVKHSSALDQLDAPTFAFDRTAEQDHLPLVKRQQIGDGTPDAAAPPGEDSSGDNKQQPNSDQKESGHDHDEEEEDNDAHKYIGLALLAGFILMFLIDQMGPTHAHSHNSHVSVADFTELHNLQLDDNNIRMPSAVGMNGGGGKKRGNPITVGLVVHAAADGIALGASASRPELRFIVFLAIMLHKAPAAFGLATVLLQHGFSRRQTRQQVAIFALAAPIGAILTYIFIQMGGQHDEALLHWWTGMLLLFSGGTFLYVAMHVMSEMNNFEKSGSSGYMGGPGGEKGLSIVEVLCVVGGMVVPLILSVDHEH
ncbi:hypothetical protein BX616_011278 [Lobosporangium transversale]|uniref:ZIP zinc transporter-domain-containing protein n=1 Tax=Lobosporangium transversale TaxID=64571 RepID=A0A1Y2H1F9_9FUNG|nr:ZIP zinc transporter-domain-containing protein [Lobosporangium transversale]KAF9917799.1 hypothetical protein BX616_011278 [Lobosporangium transversale]ORZ28389.1 ZIP zinc transporter-domain-containing protein [Lobosporangium transversale]|eukprot:XP_021886074.1 ZIP zinc transporter-domain-containing protein [Lobosporangium transversale]